MARAPVNGGGAVSEGRAARRRAFRAETWCALVALLGAVGAASCQRSGNGSGGPDNQGGLGGRRDDDSGGTAGTGAVSAGAGGGGASGTGTSTGGTAAGGEAQGGAAGGSTGGAPLVDGGLPPDAGPPDLPSELDGPTCGEVTASNVEPPLPPEVLILLDRSGSMQEDLTGMTCPGGSCGATSKWSIATTAMGTFLASAETTVNWGLKLFATGTSTTCSVSNTVEVSPAPSNAAAINTVLAQTVASSSTPTTSALMKAAAYLSTITVPNPKFILLVTDGLPTCGTSACAPGVNSSPSPQCDDANAIAMVKTVRDQGFPVFVLGIGTESSPGDATLSMMAELGGYPRAASPAYYPINSGDELSRTLGTIAGLVSACYFGVTPALKSASEVLSVTGDGTPIPPDPANGWTFVSMPTSAGIQLNGKSCEDYRNATIKSVLVNLACSTR